MTRSIKDLREFINISRLSFRDSDDSDNEGCSVQLPNEHPLSVEESRPCSISTNQLAGSGEFSAKGTVLNYDKHFMPDESNVNDIVIGRPDSAIGARRPPSATRVRPSSSQRSRTQENRTKRTHAGGTRMRVSSGIAPSHSLDEKLFTTGFSQMANESDDKLHRMFDYIDTVIVSSWLEKCNDYLDRISNWLKLHNNFIHFAHFLLSNLEYLKRKELFELEISVIFDELQFAFKTGTTNKSIKINDLNELMSVVLREYPKKLYSSSGCVCILNIYCILCCGKNETFKNLFSNVKYSTRNTQVAQWMLAIRAFCLLSICNGVLEFYKNVSEDTGQSEIGTFSEQDFFTDIRHYWLFKSVELNKMDVVQFLLKNLKFDVSCVIDRQGRNLIFKAVVCGSEKILELLVEKVSPKIDLNQCADSGNSPIHAAVSKGHVRIVDLLLRNGASVNQRNIETDGFTPLHMAVMNGDLNIVKLLVDNGADANSRMGSMSSVTPIGLANDLNHTEIFEYLKTL